MPSRFFAIFLILLAATAWAGPSADPFAADPYARIGATPEMTGPELRRAFMLAVNHYNPSLNFKATPEQFASIQEAGRLLFGGANEQGAPTIENSENVVSLSAQRFRKQLNDALPIFKIIADAAREPRKASQSQLDAAARLLENELDTVRQSLRFVPKGRLRAPTYTDIMSAVHRTERTRRDIDAENNEKLIEAFILWNIDEVERPESLKMTLELAKLTGTPEGSVTVFNRSLDLLRSRSKIDLFLAHALTENGVKALRYEEKRVLIHTAFSESKRFDDHPFMGDGLADYLEDAVLDKVDTSYDRKLLLESIEPALTNNLTPALVRTVSRIARADWLSFDVSGVGQKMLNKWALSNKMHNIYIRGELEAAMHPNLAPLKRPMGICMKLLTKKTLDWFQK